MNLIVQGAGIESADASRLAAISGAKTLEQIGELAWRLRDAADAAEIAAYCEGRRLDHAWVPDGRRFAELGLMAMDMDSTLITIECIDEIGGMLGIKAEIAAITARAMRGEIDYAESLKRRVAFLAGLGIEALDRVYHEKLRLSPGAERLVRHAQGLGIKTLLVSGGFTFFTERLKNRLGLDHTLSNVLEIEDGKLTGRVSGDIVDAAAKGARLVVLDNHYPFGRPAGRKLTEETLFNPCSKKGEIRARLHLQLTAAVQRGDVQAVTGRAADFYGPGGVQTLFADRFWPAALAGKSTPMIVPLDTPHTYHFIPDVAAGLATLGQDPSASGTFMLPCQPAESTRALVNRLGEALGRPITATRMPPLLLRGLGLFMPILRELREMAYQWEEPFEVDDARFRARHGAPVASRAEAARQSVEWGRAAFGGAAKR